MLAKLAFYAPLLRPQFGELVLPACTLLLEKSKLTYAARANPVKVVRAISAMVRSLYSNASILDRTHCSRDKKLVDFG